jgi:hypothetical protein
MLTASLNTSEPELEPPDTTESPVLMMSTDMPLPDTEDLTDMATDIPWLPLLTLHTKQ